MRDTSLSPIARLVGYGIASHLNRDRGSTYVYPSTLARKLGTKFGQTKEVLRSLVQAGHLRIRGPDLIPIVRADAPLPLMAGGGKDFQERRARWLEWVMFNDRLSVVQRVIAYGIAALLEPAHGYCDVANRTIASEFGVSPRAVDRAVAALWRVGYVERERDARSSAYRRRCAGWCCRRALPCPGSRSRAYDRHRGCLAATSRG